MNIKIEDVDNSLDDNMKVKIDYSKYSSMDLEQKKEFQQLVFNDLVERVENFSTSEASYKSALIDYGKFTKYSLYNRMLLSDQLAQNGRIGEAPVFKTYNEWKNEGVFVKKGAKAYSIIVPNQVEKYKDGEVWKNITTNNKEEVKQGGYETKKFTFFNLKNVAFHISDTNSVLNIVDAGENNRFTIDAENEEKFELLYNSVKSAFSKKYDISDNQYLDSELGGLVKINVDTGRVQIEINANSTSSMKLRTLFHEVAHIEAEHLHDRNNIPKEIQELEAESSAFLLGRKYGIDSEISELYLKSYSKSYDIANVFSKVFEITSSIEDEFKLSINENINERDVNNNKVADINEDDLYSNVNSLELL